MSERIGIEACTKLPRQIGKVDARLLREANRQFLHGANGLESLAGRAGLFRESCNRRFRTDEGDVAEQDVSGPQVDDFVLEHDPGVRRHRRSSPPISLILIDE